MERTLPMRLRTGRALVACLWTIAAGLGLWALLSDPDGPSAAPQQVPAGEQPTARSLQDILAHPDLIASHAHPLLGKAAPDFALADGEGKVWALKDLRADGPVVLIFYLGYHCDHCVQQLFDVDRDLSLFREVGAQVAAISADPSERGRSQESSPFRFPVLSDPNRQVTQAYRVLQPAPNGTPPGRLRHGTFLIDQEGAVHWVNVGDAPFRRNTALLSQLLVLRQPNHCSSTHSESVGQALGAKRSR